MAPERYRAANSRPTTRRSNPSSRPTGQRPANRPKTLSPEERRRRELARKAEIRRQKEEKARLRRLRRARRRRLFRICFWVSLAFVALYWAIISAVIITRPDGSEDALPLLLFTQGEMDKDKEYPPDKTCIGKVKYLPVHFLDDYITISQFGDHKTRSFLICSTGEYATFYLNTEEAIINGEHVSLKAPALMIDGILHLPVDFYAEKMTCFELGKNNTTYGADVLTFLKDVDAAFVYSDCNTSDPVKYETVPVAPTVPPTQTPAA